MQVCSCSRLCSKAQPMRKLSRDVHDVRPQHGSISRAQLMHSSHAAGPEGSFVSGSLDSLSAVELANALAVELALALPGTLVFDYPSVRAMAGFLHAQLAGMDTKAELPATPATEAAAPRHCGHHLFKVKPWSCACQFDIVCTSPVQSSPV